ncbi:MAG: biotin transporter BioY [Clostridiales bacterium]|nr:biotin transporter BioY [Clostridiales bacterium]
MRGRTMRICYCALFCALIILSTLLFRFTIPGTDVMVTLQVFFVLLCGQLMPVRYCLYTTLCYLLAGLIGLPVFSAVNGPAVLATPSFGYLLAFPAAAGLCSLIRQHTKKGSRYLASFSGVAVMYVIASAYVVLLSKVYLQNAFSLGSILISYVGVFLPLDIVKGICAAWLGERLNRSGFGQL